MNGNFKRFEDLFKNQKTKNWSNKDWEKAKKEFEEICKELTYLLKKKFKAESKEVQNVIRKYDEWLKKFWTPTKKSYIDHAELILESDLRKFYEIYSPELPEFLGEAIRIFSEQEFV